MELHSAIITKVCAIESSQKDMQCKLSKLDKIEADLKAISNKLTQVEVKVMSLEHKMSESDKKTGRLRTNVKAKAREHLSNTTFRVGDQYPKEIQDRRRKLVPYLVQARQTEKLQTCHTTLCT